jgi:hypothetical protein
VTPKQEMQEAYNIWVYSLMMWHYTKNGKIDYSNFPSSFAIQDESGLVTFPVDIPSTKMEKLASNAAKAMTGVIFTAFDSAMDKAFNKSDKNNPAGTTGLLAARVIVFQIRNAFAHEPTNPKWRIYKAKHRKSFEISEIDLTINLEELNGQDFNHSQVKGFVGLTRLLDYCLRNVKDD